MEATTVPRADGVPEGVPVFQLDRPPLERLIQRGRCSSWWDYVVCELPLPAISKSSARTSFGSTTKGILIEVPSLAGYLEGGEDPCLTAISESAAVDFGDWLHTIANSMGDISPNSSVWWKEVMENMTVFYDAYVRADLFHRLTMEPQPSEELKLEKLQRVDCRAATMIVAAVPETIRLELVASRVQTTLG